MPDTVDDFMSRFGGGNQTIDDQQAAQYHERFVSDHPDDNAFDKQAYQQGATEYLGQLPDDQFHQAASNAIAQSPPEERAGLLGSIMQALSGAGSAAATGGGGGIGNVLGALGGLGGLGGLGAIASKLGLGSTDPSKMSNDDAARVLNYARQQNPDALQKVVEEKPWFVKALGNPVVMGALTMAAAKLVQRQRGNS